MTASVIVPNHKSEATLPRTLASIEKAAKGLDVEVIVSDDPNGNGLSWARNQGINKAKGDFIFFVDADDTVEPDFFRAPLENLAQTKADFCIFQYEQSPLKRDYNIEGNDAIRSALLAAFMGYSFDDVRRWNAGGALAEKREMGSVCRAAFSADFINSHSIRFDENLFIYEDAPFFCECALYASKISSLPRNLYNYIPNSTGIIATVTGSLKHWNYKFAINENRKRLAQLGGEKVLDFCRASFTLGALEMLVLWRSAGLSFMEMRSQMATYLSEPLVTDSIRRFPLSFRHIPTALAVQYLRLNLP